jgi:type IV secretory pathway TraG/TraD family ATPase VirD4
MDRLLQWGYGEMPIELGTQHFLVVGATGSGKTTIINILQNSIFGNQHGQNCRAFVYDPKQEALPTFNAMGCSPERIIITHPFDKRGARWDIAKDIDSPVTARQIATILVPESSSSDSADNFFTNAVRDLLAAVLMAFADCIPNAGKWDFRDVILAMLYQPYLEFILSRTTTRKYEQFSVGKRLIRSYLRGDSRTTSNILATISAKMSIYEPIAAIWNVRDKSFSIKEWSEDGNTGIIILGNDEACRVPIDAINAAIFKRSVEKTLARRNLFPAEEKSGQNMTWFFLDEVREAGRLDGLGSLLNKGRSKGACIVLGFQDIDGMRDVYGEEVANEIAGQCNSLAILQVNSPSTAEWASNCFGKHLKPENNQSISISDDIVQTQGTSNEVRNTIETGQFILMPKTNPKTGLPGYFRNPAMSEDEISRLNTRKILDWDEIIAPNLPKTRESKILGFDYDDKSSQYLRLWDDKDWIRLGFMDAIPDPFKEIEEKTERNIRYNEVHTHHDPVAMRNVRMSGTSRKSGEE